MYNENIFVRTLLDILAERGIPTDKIHIQKYASFLADNLEDIPFGFSIHTYGPFSAELSSTLDTMLHWDDLRYDKDEGYAVEDSTTVKSLPEEEITKLETTIDRFHSILPEDTRDDFSAMELYGTLYYYMRRTNPLDKNIVFEKFREVKKNRYDDLLEEAYRRLNSIVS